MQGACLQHAVDGRAYRSESSTGDIDSPEHLIEQRRFASNTRSIERFLQAVVEEIRRIEVDAVVKLATECPDVANINRDVAAYLSCHGERQVLNIWSRIVRIESHQRCGSICNQDRLH